MMKAGAKLAFSLFFSSRPQPMAWSTYSQSIIPPQISQSRHSLTDTSKVRLLGVSRDRQVDGVNTAAGYVKTSNDFTFELVFL